MTSLPHQFQNTFVIQGLSIHCLALARSSSTFRKTNSQSFTSDFSKLHEAPKHPSQIIPTCLPAAFKALGSSTKWCLRASRHNQILTSATKTGNENVPSSQCRSSSAVIRLSGSSASKGRHHRTSGNLQLALATLTQNLWKLRKSHLIRIPRASCPANLQSVSFT